MKGFIVDVEFVWGFQSRIAGLSKTNPSFYYPPPTTFIGALAEVIAKKYNFGESKGREIIPLISKKLLAIGIKPVNCIPIKYEDINRIITIKWTSGVYYPSPSDLSKSFDSPARGKTILSSIDGNSPKLRWFIVLRDTNFNSFNISIEDFWGIHRSGSKESVVSVVDVVEIDDNGLESSKGIRDNVNYSFPLLNEIKLIKELTGRWISEVYIDPFDVEAYNENDNPVVNYIAGKKLLPFLVPLKLTAEDPEYIIEFSDKLRTYKYDNEVIVGWK